MCTQPENVAEFEIQNDKSIHTKFNFSNKNNNKNMKVIKFAILFANNNMFVRLIDVKFWACICVYVCACAIVNL